MYNQQKQYNETLEPVANFSFPFNHLITVGLVKRIAAPSDKTDFKEKMMFFVSLIPGIIQDNSQNRTYEFKSALRQKYSTREIFELSFAFKQAALGNYDILPYQKFTQDKMSSIYTAPNQQKNTTQIFFNISQGKASKISVPLSRVNCYSFSQVLEKMANHALDLEFENQSGGVFKNNNHYETDTENKVFGQEEDFTPQQSEFGKNLTNTFQGLKKQQPSFTPKKGGSPF